MWWVFLIEVGGYVIFVCYICFVNVFINVFYIVEYVNGFIMVVID